MVAQPLQKPWTWTMEKVKRKQKQREKPTPKLILKQKRRQLLNERRRTMWICSLWAEIHT